MFVGATHCVALYQRHLMAERGEAVPRPYGGHCVRLLVGATHCVALYQRHRVPREGEAVPRPYAGFYCRDGGVNRPYVPAPRYDGSAAFAREPVEAMGACAPWGQCGNELRQ